jgi:NAD(P)-dependent dehydrogenase (short-subunit alcohol dehydrogenase family)
LYVRQAAIEGAVIEEVGRRFREWSDLKHLTVLVNEELRAAQARLSAEAADLEQDLERVRAQIENVRRAVKDGLDDIAWANAELRKLKLEEEALLRRQQQAGVTAAAQQLTPAQVEAYRREFATILGHGTNEEKRLVLRAFVRKIEVNPATGDIVIWLYQRPPGPAKGDAPSGLKGRSNIGLVAGAGFEPATSGL